MSFIKVDTNTNPIPEGVLDPKNFSFPSGGGGGGGGGGTYYVKGVNAQNQAMAGPLVAMPDTEIDLINFGMNFHARPTLLLAFLALPAGILNADIRLYIDDTLQTHSHVSAGGNFSWGFLLSPSPMGLKNCTLAIHNFGEAFTINNGTYNILEFTPEV